VIAEEARKICRERFFLSKSYEQRSASCVAGIRTFFGPCGFRDDFLRLPCCPLEPDAMCLCFEFMYAHHCDGLVKVDLDGVVGCAFQECLKLLDRGD